MNPLILGFDTYVLEAVSPLGARFHKVFTILSTDGAQHDFVLRHHLNEAILTLAREMFDAGHNYARATWIGKTL